MNELDKEIQNLGVGLFFQRTGIPLYILATTCDVSSVPMHLTDPTQIPESLVHTGKLIDQTFIDFVQAYFVAGGRELRILPVQVPKSTGNQSISLAKLILGSDMGFRKKTGAVSLNQYDAIADLLAVPQAPIFMSKDELRHFYQNLLMAPIMNETCFLLVDPPRFYDHEELAAWSRSFDDARAIISYPWLIVENQWFTPPSIPLAVHIQINDRVKTIADSPGNIALDANIKPIREFASHEILSLNRAQVNVFRTLPNKNVVLWGNYTSSRSHTHNAAIPVARTIASLKDAVVRTVDPFLMEPRTKQTCAEIEYTLNEMFWRFHEAKIFSPEKREDAFQINCHYKDKRGSWDASIEIDVRFVLDRSDAYIGFNVGC